MQRILKCAIAVSLCALLATTHAQTSETVLIMDGEAAQALEELEPRTILMPPGEGELLPASLTAVITINSPGSYVLGSNVIGVAGKHGIEIKKSNVTLDLNGFALVGTTDSLSGINVPLYPRTQWRFEQPPMNGRTYTDGRASSEESRH